ncbi:ABC transporter ATP-binding protein [Salinirussus salinus]|jgi:ABC-2 type transport system ATP-binding protein|uniref:ABC transporter ATP-binding protein n=1 Tax=Salinirussus salinus TaxID=1198300 RepID=UPI0013587134|nr:ABC transporter ATP-binding protein [Salinirussus salinus]
MTAIETDGLTKQFGDLTPVDGLDLAVERGEVFGFLGPNGAGKSTTINMLLGFLEPTAGSATVLGHDVETESRRVRERIGVLPEAFQPYDRLSAREHVEYAAGIKECRPDVEGLLERVGLDREAWDRPAGEYSKGMCQRLALATALVGDPDLLVLDEPSSGLDPEGMAEMRELIRSEAEAGTTVFFSSHLLSEVEAVCDRVGILSGGDLAAVGSLAQLRQESVSHVPMTVTVDAVPEDVAADLAALDGVRSVTADGTTIRVELDDPGDKVRVVRTLDERARVEDIISEEKSLEAMFESYTRTDAGSGGDPPSATRADGSESASGEPERRPAEVAR